VRSLLKLVIYLGIPALLVNWWVVSRTVHPAEPFAGGRVVEVTGPDVNVREYGDGPNTGAIVLVHGYTGSIEWWEKVAEPLAEQTGRKVIALDMVGHGGSESPKESRAYGAIGQALAVRRALAALKADDVVLVGHSMGGGIATLVAESEPGLVERVAVIDTFGAPDLKDLGPLAASACWPVLGEAIDRLRAIDLATKSSLQRGFAPDFPIPDFAYTSLKRMTQRGFCKSEPALVHLNAQRPIARRLADLGKPVLVLWGSRDELTPTAANVAAYRDAGIRPEVIQRSGHSPQVERPKAILKLLSEFVS
jgi:2-succinyl-6-hydroxy-2,4-cyclohexadiene-1-carboxylate synthase